MPDVAFMVREKVGVDLGIGVGGGVAVGVVMQIPLE